MNSELYTFKLVYSNWLLAHMQDMLHLGDSHDNDHTMRVLMGVPWPFQLFLM